MRPRSSTAVIAAVAAVSLAAGTPAAAASSWTIVPSCASITGAPGLTYTTDGGATLRPGPALRPVTYTFGLAALSAANNLMATQEVTIGGVTTTSVYRSTNAGCTWTRIRTLGSADTNVQATAAPGGLAYLWSATGGGIFQVTGSTVTKVGRPATPRLLAFAVDPADAGRLRVVGEDGHLFQSTNGGDTWSRAGSGPAGTYVESAAIDPRNLNHVVVGALDSGIHTTWNSGASWTQAGEGTTNTKPTTLNAFSVAISPIDSNQVFFAGVDRAQADAGHPSQGRHIYRSTNGGGTFHAAVDDGGDITITNGPRLYPSPAVAGDVTWTYGFNSSQLELGTFVYTYRAATDAVTTGHNSSDGVSAIAFHPGKPSVMYLGLRALPRESLQ